MKQTCMVSSKQGRLFPIMAETDEVDDGDDNIIITFDDTGIMVSREEITKVIEFLARVRDGK